METKYIVEERESGKLVGIFSEAQIYKIVFDSDYYEVREYNC